RNGAEALAVLVRRASAAERGPLVDALVALAQDADPSVRLAVVFGLERIDDPRALGLLQAAGRDAAVTVRTAAIRALRERRSTASLTTLLATPGADALEVARALSVLTDPDARRAVQRCLSARDVALRLACAQALWEVDDRSGKGVLLATLRSRDD